MHGYIYWRGGRGEKEEFGTSEGELERVVRKLGTSEGGVEGVSERAGYLLV